MKYFFKIACYGFKKIISNQKSTCYSFFYLSKCKYVSTVVETLECSIERDTTNLARK